jgi:GNAT superfamily N-acetyltransferase
MRDFTVDDYAPLLEVYNANYPDYTRTIDSWRIREENIDKTKYLLKRYVYQNTHGTILGFGEIAHSLEAFHPQKFWLYIYVDPNYQNQGIGSYIYNSLIEELRLLDAILVSSAAKEDLPKHVAFLEKRGFEEVLRAWESRLDLNTFDGAPFKQYTEKVAKDGVVIITLAEERSNKNPNFMKQLHDLVQHVSSDMPQSQPFTPVPYEQWEALEMKNPDLIPEAYMIAKDKDELVGLSVLWSGKPEPNSLYQGNTGVRRDYRGRGIAFAMKLRVIEYAKNHGYVKLKTWNASNNAAMLNINVKLGFKRQVGWITFEKILSSD